MLTDNGVAFTNCASTRWDTKVVPFDRVCREHGIAHKLTKPYHPWTNGQAERMNRTLKEATVKAFHYETADALAAHVLAFVRAYNFAKHLKALKWRTPFQAICDAWAKDPSVFKINPHHLIPGPNTRAEAPQCAMEGVVGAGDLTDHDWELIEEVLVGASGRPARVDQAGAIPGRPGAEPSAPPGRSIASRRSRRRSGRRRRHRHLVGQARRPLAEGG